MAWQDKWHWFWNKYPAPQAGMNACKKVYQDVMAKYAITLRRHANECVRDYLGAVLYEMNTRLYADLEKGEIPAERLLGGLDALGSLVDILYQLEVEHTKEYNKKNKPFTEDN